MACRRTDCKRQRQQRHSTRSGRRSQHPAALQPSHRAALAAAYERRAAALPTALEEYETAKAHDPEFYRAADSMLYGVRAAALGQYQRTSQAEHAEATELVGEFPLAASLVLEDWRVLDFMHGNARFAQYCNENGLKCGRGYAGGACGE